MTHILEVKFGDVEVSVHPTRQKLSEARRSVLSTRHKTSMRKARFLLAVQLH
jgi:hypothetical protein